MSSFEIYSFRRFGDPKIKKPKELRGIKQIFSIEYIPDKCRCQVFVKGKDVWVKHRDYFSGLYSPDSDELGLPLDYFAEKFLGKNRPKKFIYKDAWGSVVLRNEAWLIIRNLLIDLENNRFELDIVNDIREQQEKIHGLEKYELYCTQMERFWEELVHRLKKEVNKNEIHNRHL